jgi:glycosyltransferase involved in cell wall biosynthesis
MKAAIVIPTIGIGPLVVRCVTECARTSPDAEILVYADDAAGSEAIDHLCEVIETGPISIAEKRNRGAERTGAPYLAFIDSDAYPADGWLDAAVAFLDADSGFAAVGGPNVSPPVESRSERHVGLAHHSALVAGWWRYRRDPEARAREVGAMPSCNLVVRRADYLAVGGMNEDLFTAEDTDFCRRFAASGRRMWFTPDVLVFHKNRAMRAFVVQRFTFGVAMAPLLRRGEAPDRAYTAASAVLAAFSLWVLAAPVVWRSPLLRRLWLASIGAYAGVVAVEAVRVSERPDDVPGTALALVIGNLAPGIGFALAAVDLAPDLQGVYRNDR